MNILPPVPTPTVFNVGTVNTESVRKENLQRETVPALAANEKSAAETGLGSEADKAKNAGQAPQPLTYEKPVPQNAQQLNTQNDAAKDNGQDASAGKENAEDQQQQQAEQKQLSELKKRDAEVKAHEQAHASIGGQYASAPKYEYEVGPDGKRYAVGGEVSIDISEASTPEETLRKAQQVKAAALAPAEPSPQDFRVATEATQMALEARTEIAAAKAQQAQNSFNEAIPEISSEAQAEGKAEQTNSTIGTPPSLDEIVKEIDVDIPTRELDAGQSEITTQKAVKLELDLGGTSEFVANRDLKIAQRVSVIENFYQQVSTPRSEAVRQTA